MQRTSTFIKTGIPLLLTALLVSTSCNNNSTQSKELSKLSDSARLVQKHIDSLRRASYRNNDLSIIFLDATSQLMQAQMALEKAQVGGNKPGIVDSLIINSNQGDSMYYALRRMYMAATAFAENDAERARFNSYTMPDSSKLWLQKYFKGLTPGAALNSLTKFQNDCSVINKIIRR
jgi:hypothetical protein